MKKFDLDDLFKNALEEQDFNFDPQAFKEFQSLSNNKNEKKRRIPILWLFLGFTLLFSGGAYFLYNNATKRDITVASSDTSSTDNNAYKPNKKVLEQVSEATNHTPNISKNILAKNVISSKTEVTNPTDLKLNRTNIKTYTSSTENLNIEKSKALGKTLTDQNILVKNHINSHNSKFTYKSLQHTASVNAPNRGLLDISFLPSLNQILKDKKRSLSFNQKVKSLPSVIEKYCSKKDAYFLRASVGRGQLKSSHYSLGIGIAISLTERFGLESGLFYNYLSASKLKPHRGFAQKFNITGSNFYHNSIEADQLHLVSIPLSLKYKYKNISLSTGMQYSYLLGVRGTITDNKEGTEASRSTWIVETGIHRNIIHLQSGVSYDLCSRWSLDLTYDHYTRSLFTEQRNAQKLSSLKLGIRYYLKK